MFCFSNSFPTPSKSLLIANNLAFSKLISLPINNSAFNSFSIEVSKLSKESAILSTCARFNPNFLASNVADVNSWTLPPKETWIDAEAEAISPMVCLVLKALPLRVLKAPICLTVFSNWSSVLLPPNLYKEVNADEYTI